MYIRRTKNNWFQHYKPDCTDIQQHESTTIHIINTHQSTINQSSIHSHQLIMTKYWITTGSHFLEISLHTLPILTDLLAVTYSANWTPDLSNSNRNIHILIIISFCDNWWYVNFERGQIVDNFYVIVSDISWIKSFYKHAQMSF